MVYQTHSSPAPKGESCVMAGIGRSAELDVLLLLKTIIYVFLSILQICSIISIETAKINLSGNCVLFAECTYGPNGTDVHWRTSPRNCDFVLYTCVVALIFLVLLSPYHMYMFYKSRWDAEVVQYLRVKPMVFLAFVFSVLGLIICSLTSGGYFIQSCTEILSQVKSWSSTKVNLAHLATDMQMAQVTLWLSTVLWIVLLGLSMVRYMQQKKYETAKRYAAALLENSRTNSDEVLFESKTGYNSS